MLNATTSNAAPAATRSTSQARSLWRWQLAGCLALLIGTIQATLPQAFAAPPNLARAEALLDMQRVMAHIGVLSVLIGARREGTAKERQTAAYVRGQFESFGYKVTSEAVRLPDGKLSQNLIAQPPQWPGQGGYYVVSAHIDSRDTTPGANDDGSGIGVLLELARVWRHIPNAPRAQFIAFGAEERWEPHFLVKAHRLNGSVQHVAHLSRGELRRIRGMVSLDMVGYGRVMQIGTAGFGTRRFADHLLRQARAAGIPAVYFKTEPWSDHVPFEKAGVPAAWIWWYPDHDFHTPRDKISRIDPRLLRASARVVLRGLLTAG